MPLLALGTRVDGLSSGGGFLSPAAENPPGCRAAAEDRLAECGGEGSLASSRDDNLPRPPSTASRSGVRRNKAGVNMGRLVVPATWSYGRSAHYFLLEPYYIRTTFCKWTRVLHYFLYEVRSILNAI